MSCSRQATGAPTPRFFRGSVQALGAEVHVWPNCLSLGQSRSFSTKARRGYQGVCEAGIAHSVHRNADTQLECKQGLE